MVAALIAFYVALCLPGIVLTVWLLRGAPLPEWLPVPVPALLALSVPDATFDHRGLA